MSRKRKFEKCKGSVADAISLFFSEIETLAGEMREAFDNTPESLQQSAVGEARGAAADALEDMLNEVEVPDEVASVGEVIVEWSEVQQRSKRQGLSRSDRRDNSVNALDAAMQAIANARDNEEMCPTCGHPKFTEDQRDALGTLYDELKTAKDNAEGVEFPGMRG